MPAQAITPPLSLSACFTVISKLPNLLEVSLTNAAIVVEGDLLRSFPSVVGPDLSSIYIRDPSPLALWDRPFCNLGSLRIALLGAPLMIPSVEPAEPSSFPRLPL